MPGSGEAGGGNAYSRSLMALDLYSVGTTEAPTRILTTHQSLIIRPLQILQILKTTLLPNRRNPMTLPTRKQKPMFTKVLGAHTQDLLRIVTPNMVQHGEGVVVLRYVATLVALLRAMMLGATGAVIATASSHTMTLADAQMPRETSMQKARALRPRQQDTRCAWAIMYGNLSNPAQVQTRPAGLSLRLCVKSASICNHPRSSAGHFPKAAQLLVGAGEVPL